MAYAREATSGAPGSVGGVMGAARSFAVMNHGQKFKTALTQRDLGIDAKQ